MKVLSRGVIPKEKDIQMSCLRCDSEFEFKQSDPEVTIHYDQRDGNSMQFKCPVCSHNLVRYL